MGDTGAHLLDQILVFAPKGIHGDIGERQESDATAVVTELSAHLRQPAYSGERLAAASAGNYGHRCDWCADDLQLLVGRLGHYSGSLT